MTHFILLLLDMCGFWEKGTQKQLYWSNKRKHWERKHSQCSASMLLLVPILAGCLCKEHVCSGWVCLRACSRCVSVYSGHHENLECKIDQFLILKMIFFFQTTYIPFLSHPKDEVTSSIHILRICVVRYVFQTNQSNCQKQFP